MQLALEPTRLRRPGHGEPVRRRDERPVRRPGGRPGGRAGRQHRHPLRHLRGGPRQRAGHRRQGAGQPDRPDPLGGPDAGAHRPAAAGAAHRTSGPPHAAEGPRADPRPGRRRQHGHADAAARSPICRETTKPATRRRARPTFPQPREKAHEPARDPGAGRRHRAATRCRPSSAILEAAGVAVDWDEHLAGQASLEQGKPALPQALLRIGHRTRPGPEDQAAVAAGSRRAATTTCSSAASWGCSPRCGR